MMSAGIKGCMMYGRLFLQDQRKHNLFANIYFNDPRKIYKFSFPNTFSFEEPSTISNHTRLKPEDFLDSATINPVIVPELELMVQPMPELRKYSTAGVQYKANSKIEDRLVIRDLQSIDGKFVGVFDGHGGDRLSQYCQHHIVQLVESWIDKNKTKEIYIADPDKLIADALVFAYKKIDTDFYENVYKTQVALNNKKIRGVGTCALSVIIHKGKIHVANSGDSEAIAVFKDDSQNVGYFELNQRFSVNNPAERRRLQNQFPDDDDIVVEDNPGCFYVKGRLQPTRAMGDYHLKYSELFKGKGKFNGPYISCIPDIKTFEITEQLKTIVVASDGIWDFIDKQSVAQSSLLEDPQEKILERCMQRIAKMHKKSVEEIKGITETDRRSFHDDISIGVVSL